MRRRKTTPLSHALALVNKELGKDVLVRGSDERFQTIRVPSGSLVVDRVTGGGFSLGRHVELFGDESACKSYLAYRTIALSQQRGSLCAVIDPEHSFDSEWFRHLGGEPESLMVSHPENAEDALGAMMLLTNNADDLGVEIIMIDSIAALVPKEETDKDPREEARIAGQARMMSRALRRITTVNKRTLFLWVNQRRTNIGIVFGNPNTTPGGKAMRFYASTRLEMVRGERIKTNRRVVKKGKPVQSPVTVGNWIQVRAEKEKTTRPYQQQSFVFDLDRLEIDLASEIIQLGIEDQIIERKGDTYYYEDIDGVEWSGNQAKFSKLIYGDDNLRDELVTAIEDQTLQISKAGADG